ncbi:carboxylesterase family protein [Shewanella halotolerans]|uniref:carboxylesterase family protein n=1 Tax=Shewanella halotolerans TaxID=2864204 RepID=UPI001C6578D9|nr:carboxylesterase family protein [Shewanella halotolerans]QYJ89748.1 carboxylesterase family protein [Shewanella halotolerans]
MTMFSRSAIAVFVTLSLAACGGSDDQSSGNQPAPEVPAPITPLPAEQIAVQIGDHQLKAMKESVVIDDLQGQATRVELEAFKGIPYASAARFEHSQLRDISAVQDATEFGYVCPQNRGTIQAQSEDCLNLNIWRPENTQAEAALPVYIFIHGGDFEVGSGADPLIQADNVVAQGALDGKPFIAITINYRLGILGSYWMDGTQAPEGGNFGLGDQKRALAWVNENIDLFGGDPNNVTLIGQEAGAMSVGILQQRETQEDIAGIHFQRAIMQSNPYGFDYKSYGQAQTFHDKLVQYGAELYQSETLTELSLTQLLAVQAKATGLTSTISAWSGIDCIDTQDLVGSSLCFASKLDSEMTPQHHLKPFAPYIEYRAKGFLKPEISGYHLTTQPAQTQYRIPTVVGFNTDDAATTSFMPSLASLIPSIIQLLQEMNDAPEGIELSAQEIQAWLASQENLNLLNQRLLQLTPEQLTAQAELGNILPGSAYEAIVKFFFGLGNNELANKLLALTDFVPNGESELSGATANMAQLNLLTNDMLFSGPAYIKAKQTSDQGQVATSLYQFDYKPSFNNWTVYNEEETIYPSDTFKSVSCTGKVCSGTELPFIFNKPYNLAGSKVKPSSTDQQLMNKLSRIWFSDELFTDHQYDTATDRVLTIKADGQVSPVTDWDAEQNSAQDPELRGGRLTGLEHLGLIMNYFDK